MLGWIIKYLVLLVNLRSLWFLEIIFFSCVDNFWGKDMIVYFDVLIIVKKN